MHGLGVEILRTYDTQLFQHTERLLLALDQLKEQDSTVQMVIMMGIWIECANAWSENPDHAKENEPQNVAEILKAVELVNRFPDHVVALAVGNESMVHWAPYHVGPKIVLKWVRHLKELRGKGEIPEHLLLTSSDNHAAWGSSDPAYRNRTLDSLIKEVDFVSVHSYPFHDTHYNPSFWNEIQSDKYPNNSNRTLDTILMERAVLYAVEQYQSTCNYVRGVSPGKVVHIGETGWASVSSGFYGPKGSCAASEHKQSLYFKGIQSWSRNNGVVCFYFEMFDEPWKDSIDAKGSENHFGLITVDGKIKMALWDQYEQLNRLQRGGRVLTRTEDTAAFSRCASL